VTLPPSCLHSQHYDDTTRCLLSHNWLHYCALTSNFCRSDACWGGLHSKETSQENDGEGTNGAEEASVSAAVERMRSRLPNQRVIKPLGNILLFQCIASGWSNEDACDEARQLIELGREGGEGGLYFSGLGEALLQMNPTAAENCFLDSILASPTTSQGLEGITHSHTLKSCD
jgi:hypothetical protein